MITKDFHRLGPAFFTAVFTFIVLVQIQADGNLEFNRDIRPILSDRCFKCHGPDRGSRKVGLRLDKSEDAYATRKKSGKHAIVPGKPEESLVCLKIFSTDPDELMPPPESKLSLTQSEKEKLRQWVLEGAVYQPHWAFAPLPDSVAVPEVKNQKWARNEIDRFVLARLERERLAPSEEASRLRWLRRVTYDLSGLPPTLEEIDGFLGDHSGDAWERVVDRLLASTAFGERMAVPWLDGARYADSYGYQSDQLSPAWPYRDWVVQAFNRNLPYDRFLTEQLAGDLLPGATREQKLATAFNRLHRQTNEGGSIEEEWRNEYVSDRVHTFGTTMLALTFECTRCHDHKFDPLTQRDYYSLAAFFNSIDEYGLYNDSAHVPTPSLLVPSADQERIMASTQTKLTEARQRVAQLKSQSDQAFSEWLKNVPSDPKIPGLIAQYSFDEVISNRFVNSICPTNYPAELHGNTIEQGRSGKAVKFGGDDELTVPSVLGALPPWQSCSVVFWSWFPHARTNAIIFHREEGTDTGFHGTEFSLNEGRLLFVIKRFWPGNALAVRTIDKVPSDSWNQISVTYDGSASAAGVSLYVNGVRAASEIVRDHLYKSPQNGCAGLSFGALFRSTGLKAALLDDLDIYDRALSGIEIRHLFDGHSLGDALRQKDSPVLEPYYLANFSTESANARTELSDAVKSYFSARDPVMETSTMEELPEPRPAYILARGRYDAPKSEEKKVTRTTPSVLPPYPTGARQDRLGLAAWLTEPRHPLTARVAVNRFWQMLFGRGLVATLENFGAQGAEPTAPELLDWLARDFVHSGWDVKTTLKKIVLSATYRQDSKLRPDLKSKDPENLLLARGPSQRLPAEMIRDTVLAASGLLDRRMSGPPVSPYSPGDLWRESNSMSPAYHQSVGGDLYRRSLYTVWKRTAPMPDMTSFDAPSREYCVVRRSVTSTPQQAFVLLNDTQFVEAARVIAEKVMLHSGWETDERIKFIFRNLTSREPDASELSLLQQLLQKQSELFTQEPTRAEKLISVGDRKREPGLDAIQLAAMTEVAQSVMNLDATVWKR